MNINDALLGPYGLLVGAILVIGWLGRQMQVTINDLRAQRDIALAGWREQTAATNAVAQAVEARNRAEEAKAEIEAAVEQARAEASARSGGGATTPRRRRPAGRTEH